MAVIDRYVLKDVSLTFLATAFVLLLIIVGNLFVRLLSRATEGKLPVDIVLPLLGFATLRAVILLLPVALLLGVMLTMGRLYRDSEMTALRACGLGYRRLYRPFFVLLVPVVVLLSALVFYVVPWSIKQADHLRAVATARTDLSGITAGRFIAASDGDWVLFVEAIEQSRRRVRNVFVHALDEGVTSIETARYGSQIIDPSGSRRLALSDGYRYEGVPGEPGYSILSYSKHTLKIPALENIETALERDAMSTAALWQSDAPADKAELQWRLSVPISAVIVVLFALPLSYARPRQGRFAKLVVAILAYVVYANMAIVAMSWTERGVIPPWLGLWWVHGVMLIFTVVLLAHQKAIRWPGAAQPETT
ncbi:MAG: LPS export ABC transporter permease LptF [Gammaproteobacteria bacterium]